MQIINILLTNHFILIASIGILGLMVGSFLNVVIYRLPIVLKNGYENSCREYLQQPPSKEPRITLAIPRSHCPKCKATILWWENIPVISYLLLRGRCHNCRTTIPWRYPVVEILGGVTAILVVIHFGVNVKILPILILTWILIAAIFIDIEHQLLPDNITLPLLWTGLLANTFNLFTTPTNAIIGAASGYLFLWVINKTFKMVRKIDGMGYGDFKLFAAFGAWFGWQALPLILLTASFMGTLVGGYLIIGKKYPLNKPLPFGPYLAIAGWLTIFWGQSILNWYIR